MTTNRRSNMKRWGIGLALAVVAGMGSLFYLERGGHDPAVDMAWAFASAIPDDPTDRARTQHRVVGVWIVQGDPRRADAHARHIDGWHRGVALAEVASAWAKAGRLRRAAAALDEANEAMRSAEGTAIDSIRLAMAEAEAEMAHEREVRMIFDLYKRNEDYAARTGAARAIVLARQGKPDEAMAVIAEQTGESRRFEVCVWRVEGYLRLADMRDMPKPSVVAAIEAAHAAVTNVPGNKQLELRLEVARRALRHLDSARATEILREATDAAVACAYPAFLKLPLVTLALRLHVERRDDAGAGPLFTLAEELVRGDMISITESPREYAAIGRSRAIAGDREAALASFRAAFDVAEAQPNPKPRAVSAVDICLALLGDGTLFRDLKPRLNHLLGTLDAIEGA